MKHSTQLWFLNIVAILLWSFQLYQIGFPSQRLILNHPDIKEYEAVGHWLFGGPFTSYISTRPFLFPLWFKFNIGLIGFNGFFLSQSLLWFASINLFHQSLIKLRLPWLISFAAGLVFCFNITLLSITYEALTEAATVFLCCLYVYIVTTRENLNQVKKLGVLLFIAVLMMLMKPIFEPLFFVLLIAVVFLLFKEPNSKHKKKNFRWLLISLLPAGFQLFLMVHYFDTFSFSGIGGDTFRNYLLSQTVSGIQNIDRNTSRYAVEQLSSPQIIQFAIVHLPEITVNYLRNLHYNISSFPNEAAAVGAPVYELNYMMWWNKFHWLAQLALPVLLFFSWKKIRSQSSLEIWRLIMLALPMYDVILLNGISYGQGDRLVLPAIPFTIGLYAMLVKVYLPNEKPKLARFEILLAVPT